MAALTIGVDVGQRIDPTAIAVAELGEETPPVFTIRFLDRLRLLAPYPSVAKRVAEVVRGAVQVYHTAHREAATMEAINHGALAIHPTVSLVVDVTGVGRPVFELITATALRDHADTMLAYDLRLVAVTFTHGDRLAWSNGGESVGKAFLVSRLQALLQTDRIKLPKTQESAALMQELLDYEIKVSEDANDRYGAFRVGSHDDLVTALGLAVLEDPREGFSGSFNQREGRWIA